MLIGVSSSGNSENILRCAELARERDMKLVTLSAFSEDNLLWKTEADVSFYLPTTLYGHAEVGHVVLEHRHHGAEHAPHGADLLPVGVLRGRHGVEMPEQLVRAVEKKDVHGAPTRPSVIAPRPGCGGAVPSSRS